MSHDAMNHKECPWRITCKRIYTTITNKTCNLGIQSEAQMSKVLVKRKTCGVIERGFENQSNQVVATWVRERNFSH